MVVCQTGGTTTAICRRTDLTHPSSVYRARRLAGKTPAPPRVSRHWRLDRGSVCRWAFPSLLPGLARRCWIQSGSGCFFQGRFFQDREATKRSGFKSTSDNFSNALGIHTPHRAETSGGGRAFRPVARSSSRDRPYPTFESSRPRGHGPTRTQARWSAGRTRTG